MTQPGARPAVLALLLGAAVVSCSNGAGSARTTTPVSVTTPSGTSPTPATEAQLIEQAVRGYFQAVAAEDYEGKLRFSTGELRALADWELEVALSLGTLPGMLEIGRLEVGDIEDGTSTVDLEATVRYAGFTDDPEDRITGPVVMQRDADGWKVTDYVLDGRRRGEGIHAAPRGVGESGGIGVEVVGVDLRDGAVLVVLSITNANREPFVLAEGTIVDESGGRLESGVPSATQRVALPSGPLETFVLWSGQDLPVDTTSFRLVLDWTGSEGGDPVQVEVPVTLGS